MLDAAPPGPQWLAQLKFTSGAVKVLREGAAVLMPNHLHVLLKPENTLARQIGLLKGRTAFKANLVMEHSGAFCAKNLF